MAPSTSTASDPAAFPTLAASTTLAPDARLAASAPQKASPAPVVSTTDLTGNDWIAIGSELTPDITMHPAPPKVTTTVPTPLEISTRADRTGSVSPPSASA